MHFTLKIHKANSLLRPIMDYTGSIGYNTARTLADLLGPLVGTTEHHVKNCKELAEELSSFTLVQEDQDPYAGDINDHKRTPRKRSRSKEKNKPRGR